MADHRTGSAQPSRVLALLWRHAGAPSQPRRGPGRSASVDVVVDAALDVADEAGLAAVTMRAVAERTGLSTMSVYTYVPGKAELLDLMVDTAYLRMERPPWPDAGWRERVALVARANLELHAAHPWLTEVAAVSRPPLGPGVMAKYDHELHAFDGTGVSDVDRDASLSFLLGFVVGHARTAHSAAIDSATTDATTTDAATTDAATTDAEWWAANQPLLERVLHADAYPLAARVGSVAGEAQGAAWDADRAWDFGLARVLDGLAALLDASPAR